MSSHWPWSRRTSPPPTPAAGRSAQVSPNSCPLSRASPSPTPARLMAIWVAQTQGDFARSRDLQGQVLAEAQRFGNPAILGHAFIFVWLLAFYEGDWDLARTLAMSSFGELGAVYASPIGSYPA